MNENRQAVDAILTAINTMTKKSLKNANFDINRRGIIREVLGSYRFKVDIKGTAYEIPSCIEMKFNIGDSVYVLFPCGNMMDGHITGKVR